MIDHKIVSKDEWLAARQEFLVKDELPQVIQGKYKLRILWHLQDKALRFGELRKELTNGNTGAKGIAPRVLSRELKSLVDLGVIQRRAYNVVPPRVEYRLTALGRTLLPVISKLVEWEVRHRTQLNQVVGESCLVRPELIARSTRSLSPPLKKDFFDADLTH